MQKICNYYIGYYKGIEAFDVVRDFSHNNYNVGTAITYLLRAGKKPNNEMMEDLKKAVAHIINEIEHIENNGKSNHYYDNNRNK